MIVSFHESDQLNEQNIKDVTKRILGSIGYENHQCIVVEHRDTDHRHLHVLVNKISPPIKKWLSIIGPIRNWRDCPGFRV